MKTELKEALRSKRYNFGDLAHHMGCNREYLSKVLNRKHTASKRFIFLLCATVNSMTGSTFTTNDFQEYMK